MELHGYKYRKTTEIYTHIIKRVLEKIRSSFDLLYKVPRKISSLECFSHYKMKIRCFGAYPNAIYTGRIYTTLVKRAYFQLLAAILKDKTTEKNDIKTTDKMPALREIRRVGTQCKSRHKLQPILFCPTAPYSPNTLNKFVKKT